MKAHQRKIREAEALREPRSLMTLEELRLSTVKQVSREQAEEIILRYEWLGTLGVCTVTYGLVTLAGELVGVACFHERRLSRKSGKAKQHSNSFKLFNEPVPNWLQIGGYLCRGACVHWAHPHAASYLISRACKLACAEFGWHAFFAYSDINAGEIGTVYQACNWLYLGRGLSRAKTGHNENTGRREWTYVGDDEHPSWTYTTKALRSRLPRSNKLGKWPFVDDLAHAKNISVLRKVPGWSWEIKPDKHKYIHLECGSIKRKQALRLLRYPILEYPKRHSHMRNFERFGNLESERAQGENAPYWG